MDGPLVVVATGNRAKAAALARIAAACRPCRLRSLRIATSERGSTFRENARRKAAAASRRVTNALVLASDGGLEIPSLARRWNPLRTSRFGGEAAPRAKARRLLEMLSDCSGPSRAAFWTEALAVARNGRLLATWTARGPRCRIVRRLPARFGAFWVDAILRRCGPGLGHWHELSNRFDEFCRRMGYAR